MRESRKVKFANERPSDLRPRKQMRRTHFLDDKVFSYEVFLTSKGPGHQKLPQLKDEDAFVDTSINCNQARLLVSRLKLSCGATISKKGFDRASFAEKHALQSWVKKRDAKVEDTMELLKILDRARLRSKKAETALRRVEFSNRKRWQVMFADRHVITDSTPENDPKQTMLRYFMMSLYAYHIKALQPEEKAYFFRLESSGGKQEPPTTKTMPGKVKAMTEHAAAWIAE